MKYILSILLTISLLLPFSFSVFADDSSVIESESNEVMLMSTIKNGLYFDDDGEIRYYVDGVATYAGVVVDNYGNYYYINSSCKAVKNCDYNISEGRANGLIESGLYFIDENGHIVNPIVILPEQNEVYFLERIYILLFILTAFSICGIFISRPRRWI